MSDEQHGKKKIRDMIVENIRTAQQHRDQKHVQTVARAASFFEVLS
jgi:hypothetical protein